MSDRHKEQSSYARTAAKCTIERDGFDSSLQHLATLKADLRGALDEHPNTIESIAIRYAAWHGALTLSAWCSEDKDALLARIKEVVKP